MKIFIKHFWFTFFIALIGFTISTCSSTPKITQTDLQGTFSRSPTWYITFSEDTFTYFFIYSNSTPTTRSGTYTLSGNRLTLRSGSYWSEVLKIIDTNTLRGKYATFTKVTQEEHYQLVANTNKIRQEQQQSQPNQSTQTITNQSTQQPETMFYVFENNNGTFMISGHRGSLSGTLVIPERINGKLVTHIGDGAFRRNEFRNNQLTSVVIPDSVTSIGENAFRNNQLTNVVIPNSVTNIGNGAFGNNQLTSVVIPNSVTSIGAYAFINNQLTSVVIPDSVTNIGYSAFESNQLTSVVIPNSVKSIGNRAFRNNQLTSVILNNSITYIGVETFADNRLTSVTIPNSVIYIGQDAFRNNQLTSVILGNSIDTIMNNAFRNNNLTNITFPNSVVRIGIGSFRENNLTRVSLPLRIGIGHFEDVSGYTFFRDADGKAFDDNVEVLRR